MNLVSFFTAGLCIASASLFLYLQRKKRYRLEDIPQFAVPPTDPAKLEQFLTRRDAVAALPLLDPSKSPRGQMELVKVDSSPSLSSLISKNGLSESPGVRMKQANGLYTSTNIPNPEDGSPYISRTVKKRNKMGYYYNTSDEHGEDVHIDLIAAKRRTESIVNEDFETVRGDDWNGRFQHLMDASRMFDTNTPLKERVRVNMSLINLMNDFIMIASTYGKIIISEGYLPDHLKTVRPQELGGIAGGSKYICHNILFKFAVDTDDFYESDYAAACVAGHELKGLIHLFKCEVPDLCLPLMALVDYRGFRLIAMSILPVDKTTIVYGTSDYGNTIHNKVPKLCSLVAQTAAELNIAPHRCGNAGIILYSPADMEGHVGKDGRFYLLDFSRVFPPETPKPGIRMAHLYRLLRPEFVKGYSLPLCSDAFTRFISEPESVDLNNNLREATRYLLQEVIPPFAKKLDTMTGVIFVDGFIHESRMLMMIHRSGINMRYLGLIRKDVTDPDLKALLLVEMCARVCKQELKHKLREKMRRLRVPLEEPYRRLIIAYLNLILGNSDHSDEFWVQMKIKVLNKFDGALTQEEINHRHPLFLLESFSEHTIDGKYLLFKRIQKMMALRFTTRLHREFAENPNCWLQRGDYPIDMTDLEDIGLRVKHMPLLSVAQGYLYKVQAELLYREDPVASRRFYQMARANLEDCIETDPQNYEALCTLGEILSTIAQEESIPAHDFIHHPLAAKAQEYFVRAIAIKPFEAHALFMYAQFLEKLSYNDLAEEYYLQSLEADPNNAYCLQEYGNFLLTARQDSFSAEKVFNRCRATNRILDGLPNSIGHVNRFSMSLNQLHHSQSGDLLK